ncbi:MAG TPA: insulinase family protein, partial [Terriglobales bacterium]|nr:insulinase family protein [Terriglobales bacterium]
MLTLVGDFEPSAALAKVKQYFGDIASQPLPPPPDMSQPAQTNERRQTVTDAFARLPRIVIAYRIPDGNSPDWFALNVLGDILTRGRAARLNQSLVQTQHLAISLSANPTQMRGPGLFEFDALLRPGKKMAALEAGIEGGVADVAAHGVSQAEVDRAVMLDYTDILSNLRGTLDRAVEIGTYAVEYHQPEMIYSVYERFRAVTPKEVQRVAKQYFAAGNRTVVITLPEPTPGWRGLPTFLSRVTWVVRRVGRGGTAARIIELAMAQHGAQHLQLAVG